MRKKKIKELLDDYPLEILMMLEEARSEKEKKEIKKDYRQVANQYDLQEGYEKTKN